MALVCSFCSLFKNGQNTTSSCQSQHFGSVKLALVSGPQPYCHSLVARTFLTSDFSASQGWRALSRTNALVHFFPSISNLFKFVLCQPSTSVPWPRWAGCWTGPPPPQDRTSSAVCTLPAPRADTPNGFLWAPAVPEKSALQNVTAETEGSCCPSSKCGASCTGTARLAKSQSLL